MNSHVEVRFVCFFFSQTFPPKFASGYCVLSSNSDPKLTSVMVAHACDSSVAEAVGNGALGPLGARGSRGSGVANWSHERGGVVNTVPTHD